MSQILPSIFFAFIFSLLSLQAQSAEPTLKIKGIKGKLFDNTHAYLRLKDENCASPKWRVKKIFEQADNDIAKALKVYGYYQPVIKKTLNFDENCWQAEFVIDKGKPVLLQAFSVLILGEAEADPAFNQLLKAIPFKKGKPVSHQKYETVKSDLKSLALERGYINAAFTARKLEIDPVNYSARINIVFESGPRFYFGDIHIQQDILDPEFVKRFISIEEKEYYSSKKLAQIYNNMADSTYFKTIEIRPEIDRAENNRVPIDIVLYPQKKHSYELGIGYDTNYGPIASGSYTNRRLNQYGHSFTAAFDVSPILSTVESRYIVPLEHPNTDNLSAGLGYKHEEPDTFVSDLFKFSLQRQSMYTSGWQQILFLDISHETYKAGDVDNSAFLLIPGGRWHFTEANAEVRATEGYHVEFSLAGTHEAVLSDVSFIQASAGAKWITTAPWYGRFIYRADLGATLVDQFDNLPATYRYYAGGTQSIRGYSYKELGPKDSNGVIIGGKMLSVFSLEYEKFIDESWGVAAFIDTGNAYNLDDISFKTGVGLGVRWNSPVGPVRVDFAIPLGESDSSFQIHFAAGAQL